LFAVDITCGDNHSVITTIKETVYGWGSNNEGQLGIMAGQVIVKEPTEISAMEFNTAGKIDAIAKVKACGCYTAIRTKSRRILVTDKKTRGFIPILTKGNRTFEELYTSPSYLLLKDNEGSLFLYGIEWKALDYVRKLIRIRGK
jgi:hypothetical protein